MTTRSIRTWIAKAQWRSRASADRIDAQPVAGGRASLLRNERGVELVEFALGSALLFGSLLAIMQGGLGIYQYNMLADLAQDGVRWAAVRGSKSGSFKAQGTITELTNHIQARDSGVTVTVEPNVDSNTLNPGTTYTVTVSRPMPGAVGFGSWTGTMRASASMQMMR